MGQSFYNTNNGELLLSLFRKSVLNDKFMPFWQKDDFYEQLVALEVGHSYTHYFGSEHTSGLKQFPTFKIPKLAISTIDKFALGQFIISRPPQQFIATIVRVFPAWLEVERFGNVLRGKNIHIKTSILDNEWLLESYLQCYQGEISLVPFFSEKSLQLQSA